MTRQQCTKGQGKRNDNAEKNWKMEDAIPATTGAPAAAADAAARQSAAGLSTLDVEQPSSGTGTSDGK